MKVIESINQGLHRAFAKDSSVLLIGEDLLDPYGGAFKASKGLSTEYSDRVMTSPVSEAGITGVAAGLALRGFRPVVEIMFGDFVMLTSDQILNHISKFRWMYGDQVKVPVVIRAPMGGRRGYGPTHSQSLEKHLLGIPHLRVVALSHVHDPGNILAHCILYSDDPVIVIENKTIYGLPLLQDQPRDWKIESIGSVYPTTLLSLADFETADLTLITYGGSTTIAMQAAAELMIEDELSVEIVNLSSLQPLLTRDWSASIQRSGVVLVTEEGTESYGIGAEISHQISTLFSEDLKLPPQRVGAIDFPIGNSPVLENAILPSKDKLKTKIREMVEKAKTHAGRPSGL